MNLAKRIGDLEDHNLTPLEAVTLWMREAHEFVSYENYARWLIEQPDDIYPLIRMPRQVVGAVRSRNKGVPDHKLRPEFYRVQKEVLFLYHLHGQANQWALIHHEALGLWVIILIKEIRALIKEGHALDQMRLARVDLEGRKHGRAEKVEKSMRAHYEEHLESWLPHAEEVRSRILAFLSAAHMISRRYFAGVDVLYPDTCRHLSDSLETIANLGDAYADLLIASQRSDNEFRDYVLALLGERAESVEVGADGEVRQATPDVTAQAKDAGRAVGAHGQSGDTREAG